MSLFTTPHLLWLSVAGLLLMAEVLGAGGYLLWSGIAAALVGLLQWLWPMPWEAQGVIFAILTLLAAFFWWWISQRLVKKTDAASGLNQRTRQMIGMQVTLLEPLQNGFSRVKIGDGSWRVKSSDPLQAGDNAIVTGAEGITLLVSAINKS
jgi:membrane protein implicated in regulation of membrane protease activity